MKPFAFMAGVPTSWVPAAGLLLLGPAALATDLAERGESAAPIPAERMVAPVGIMPHGKVIDPDNSEVCERQITEAYGNEADAQFRREPASPERVLPFYAVDHQVEGCDVLVMITGEKRSPPALPERPALYPAR